MSTVLVTGGAGYIGSHTCVELILAGHDVVVVDNLDNSSAAALDGVAAITGGRAAFHEIDVCDASAVDAVFGQHPIDAVIHFAGLKAVGESVQIPLRYYANNVGSTLTLLEVMKARGCHTMVFSSSCTVYGDPEAVPVTEEAPRTAVSPYGNTKLIQEHIFEDIARADPEWRISLLRYFNPVGAHPSGLIGEDPLGIPNSLMPYVMQVAVGRLEKLTVFGEDYDTPDGTCVRDYLHVVDLAKGHLAALDVVQRSVGSRAYNLGTGVGTSVLEVIRAAEAAVGRPIAHEIGPRRPGDAAVVYGDPTRARKELGWVAELGIADMVRDHWNWQHRNPDGFRS